MKDSKASKTDNVREDKEGDGALTASVANGGDMSGKSLNGGRVGEDADLTFSVDKVRLEELFFKVEVCPEDGLEGSVPGGADLETGDEFPFGEKAANVD